MFKANMLKSEMVKRGYKVKDLAAAIGISCVSLSHRMSGRTDWNSREMMAVRKFLNITLEEFDAIFFAEDVN